VASFNRVILLGNVTRDLEVKFLQSGMAVTEVGLAVNDRRKDDSGNWIEETTFVDVTLWGRTAEIAGEYLMKGSPVLIEGRLKLDSWEKDGKKNYKLRVVGEKMQLIPTGKGNTPPDESSQQETRQRPRTNQRQTVPAASQDVGF
jgi:single-strand DNA-binding protein